LDAGRKENILFGICFPAVTPCRFALQRDWWCLSRQSALADEHFCPIPTDKQLIFAQEHASPSGVLLLPVNMTTTAQTSDRIDFHNCIISLLK